MYPEVVFQMFCACDLSNFKNYFKLKPRCLVQKNHEITNGNNSNVSSKNSDPDVYGLYF